MPIKEQAAREANSHGSHHQPQRTIDPTVHQRDHQKTVEQHFNLQSPRDGLHGVVTKQARHRGCVGQCTGGGRRRMEHRHAREQNKVEENHQPVARENPNTSGRDEVSRFPLGEQRHRVDQTAQHEEQLDAILSVRERKSERRFEPILVLVHISEVKQ